MTRAKKIEYALIVAACALAILLIATSFAYAQTPQSPARAGLIPCGVGVTQGGFISSRCQACDLVALAQNVINFLIYIAAFVAALMFAWAGWLFMSARGSEENISRARGIFGDILFGFIWMLAAWLIVDTLMKYLLTGQFNLSEFGGWKTIQCVDQTLPAALRLAGEDPIRLEGRVDFGPAQRPEGYTTTEDALNTTDHFASLSYLDERKIKYTSTAGESGVRSDCTGTGCTNFSGVAWATLETAAWVKSSCDTTLGTDCSIIISGANEGGDAHSTHRNGRNLDFQDAGADTNRFFQTLIQRGDLTKIQDTGLGPRYRDTRGNCWLREGGHWHLDQGCRA